MLHRFTMIPSPFDFLDPIEFLISIYQERRKDKPNYSLHTWAEELNIRNSLTLTRVLQRQEQIDATLREQLVNGLPISDVEKEFFELLVMAQNHDPLPPSLLAKAKALGKAKDRFYLLVDEFRLIADWYHLVILEMPSLKDFEPNPQWISERLEKKVSPQTCQRALDRLMRLGLLKKTGSGDLQRFSEAVVSSDGNGSRSEVIQNFHRQMMDQAKEALTKDVHLRSFEGTTLSIKSENLERAKAIIKEAHQRLCQLAEDSNADEIYHFSTQFFPVVTTKGERTHAN